MTISKIATSSNAWRDEARQNGSVAFGHHCAFLRQPEELDLTGGLRLFAASPSSQMNSILCKCVLIFHFLTEVRL